MDSINRAGQFFLSATTLNGRYVLRIAIGNIGTIRQTLDALWEQIASLAQTPALVSP